MFESPLCRVLAAQDQGELAKARPERSGVPFSLARQLRWADSSKSKEFWADGISRVALRYAVTMRHPERGATFLIEEYFVL